MNKVITQRLSFQILLFMGFLCLFAAPVQAGTFTVNSAVDAIDANAGDGACETALGNGECTLRAAVQETNALAGADTINLPAGTYTLSIVGRGEDQAATGDLDIHSSDLTINGAGPTDTIIDGGQIDRVFEMPFSEVLTVGISNVTIRNGLGTDARGGGGINNRSGVLTVTDTVITGNEDITGGAISTFNGTVTIRNSAISNNTASTVGGAIFSPFGSLNISDSNIVDNSVSVNGGGIGAGGTVTISNTRL